MNEKRNLSYMDSVHRTGRIWGIIVGIIIFQPYVSKMHIVQFTDEKIGA